MPAFRALFGVGGVGIDVGTESLVELQSTNDKTEDIVGVGGDGGDSVSP
jgi:hypothetical protein